MEKKSNRLSIEEAQKLASSSAGQQLISTLKQADPDVMQKAMADFSKGDYSQLSKTLAPLLESEDVKKLLKQLGG